jgi:DNA-binding transcriptional ArsR family regulator
METEQTPGELLIEFFQLKKAALIYRAINNKVRLQIVQYLHDHTKLTVTSLYGKLRMDQSATSQHLAILRKAGLVNTERDGKHIYYSVNYDRLKELHVCAERFSKAESV